MAASALGMRIGAIVTAPGVDWDVQSHRALSGSELGSGAAIPIHSSPNCCWALLQSLLQQFPAFQLFFSCFDLSHGARRGRGLQLRWVVQEPRGYLGWSKCAGRVCREHCNALGCARSLPTQPRVSGMAVGLQAASSPQPSIQSLLMNKMHFLTRRGF